ncbi:hypothetical protein ACWCPQ_02820 [Nocardia sp. NPDC001965]
MNANVTERLNDEGEAKLFGVEVLWEIERNGGPYIKVGGAEYSQYESIYEQMVSGEMSRAEAATLIGRMHDSSMPGSTIVDRGEQGAWKNNSYGDAWRAHFVGVFMNKYGAFGMTPD